MPPKAPACCGLTKGCLGLALAVGAFCWAPPAWAWGPMGQGLIAERALAKATPRAPWLTAQREAVLWGALASTLRWLPEARGLGLGQAQAPALRAALARQGQASKAGLAFRAGWEAALAAEEVLAQRWPGGAAGGWLAALPHDRQALALDWALEQALVGQASPSLQRWAVGCYWHVAGPGGLLVGPVAESSGLAEASWRRWGQLLVAGFVQGPQALLQELARLGGWGDLASEQGRSPAVRQALGEGPGALAAAAEAAGLRLLAVAEGEPPASPARPWP